MKLLLIYNPNSGKSYKISLHLPYIINTLKTKFEVDTYQTTCKGDATKKAKEACGVYDYLIVCGGDGTFNEAINGIAAQLVRPILGYFPTGTACDMGYNLSMSNSIKKCVKAVLDGKTKRIDIGKVNQQYFAYAIATGLFSSSAYNTVPFLKKRFGRASYIVKGIEELFDLPNIDLEIITGGKIYKEQGLLLIITNSKSIGGFRINRKRENDGTLDILILKKSVLGLPTKVFKFFALGMSNNRQDKKIVKIGTERAVINISNHYLWTYDGEIGECGSIEVSVLPNHIQVIVGK